MTTKIEWTDETWNPVTGCTKVSQGCKNCYAERLAPKVFAGQVVPVQMGPNEGPGKRGFGQRPRVFTDVRAHPDRLDTPLTWRKPRRVFVNSMSDLFHEDVPFEFIDHVWLTMIKSPQHTFQILTKRPARMLEFFKWEAARCDHPVLPNVWPGVSVEDQPTADERIPLLLQTPAAVRFVSYEPALGPVKFGPIVLRALLDGKINSAGGDGMRPLDWIIAGGESGPGARPAHPDWFRSVRDECVYSGVAFFFKQWGEWAPTPPMEALTNGKRGAAIDIHGKTPSIEDLDKIVAGDASPLKGRIQMSRLGKKAAGRQLDGRTHDEYPA